MIQEDRFALTELDRRVSNMVQFGTVCEADYANAKVKVKIGDIVTNWLPWITARAGKDVTWWAMDIGEQVVVLAPSGELNQAVVLPAIYQQQYSAPASDVDAYKTVYNDGTSVSYNRASHEMMVDVNAAGKLELKVGASSIVMTSEGIKLVADRIDLN